MKKIKKLIVMAVLVLSMIMVNQDVRAAEVKSGWLVDSSGNIIMDSDGYYVYTITDEDIDSSGNIEVDGSKLAELLSIKSWNDRNMYTISSKIKISNKTSYSITYSDYDFSTSNVIGYGDLFTTQKTTDDLSDKSSFGWGKAWESTYNILVGNTSVSTTYDAMGFDGENVRSITAAMRSITPASNSLYNTNSGRMQLKQMLELPDKIKEAISFENSNGVMINLPADPNRTYADFQKAYYGVSSLDDLTIEQITNIFGTGVSGSSSSTAIAGQSLITNYQGVSGGTNQRLIPRVDLDSNSNNLDYFKVWGLASIFDGNATFTAADYPYKNNYYIMENDPEILALGYEYLYDRCIRFTFDNDILPMNRTGVDTYHPGALGVKSFIDKKNENIDHVEQVFKSGDWVETNGEYKLDNVRVFVEVPNSWSAPSLAEFNFSIMFKSNMPMTPPPTGVGDNIGILSKILLLGIISAVVVKKMKEN